VVVTDLPPTTVLLTNREATRLTGVSVGPVGPVPVPVVDPGQAAERPRVTLAGRDTPLTFDELPLSRVLATGQVQTAELELSLEGGTRVSVESIAAPIPDEQGATHSAVVVFSDVSARKRAEAERRSMQDELIRMQAAALAERSTPLIPITDEILVLPLIGSLDTERSAQLLDVLLQGVSQNGAKVAIIDITGVRTLDTQAASALTQAAQALRLLGVDPILTGIRAEVAQTLVSLGVPLAGIVTRSTLQRGIAYARKRLGQKDLDE
jgi:anti-anti-sigma regulatory factor